MMGASEHARLDVKYSWGTCVGVCVCSEKQPGKVNFREKEKQVLDQILGPGRYDARIRPSGVNGTGESPPSNQPPSPTPHPLARVRLHNLSNQKYVRPKRRRAKNKNFRSRREQKKSSASLKKQLELLAFSLFIRNGPDYMR